MRLPGFLTRERHQSPAEEHRAAGYSNAAVDALLASAGTARPDAMATAAAESCIGLIARMMALAEVSPANLGTSITPDILASMGRALASTGNAVYLAEVADAGLLVLRGPASDFEVAGRSLDRRRWSYRLTLAVPSGEIERRASAAGVFHAMVNAAPGNPATGRGPLQLAGLTAGTLANIEASLRADARAPTVNVIPLPHGSPAANATRIAAALGSRQGGTQLLEALSTYQSTSDARNLRNEYQQHRLGPEPPAANTVLRDSSAAAVMTAYGVSPQLWVGDGQIARESYRLFALSTLQPMAAVIAAELTAMYGTAVGLTFESGQWRDHRTLSNAVGKYIDAGLSVESVRRLMGLPSWVEFEDEETIASRAVQRQMNEKPDEKPDADADADADDRSSVFDQRFGAHANGNGIEYR